MMKYTLLMRSPMSLFVGNISRNVNLKDITREFEEFGECKIDLRGSFAFIEYTKEIDAEGAKDKLQGYNLGGLRLNVEWSKKSGKFSGKDDRRGGRDDRRGGRRSRSRSGGRDRRRNRRSDSRERRNRSRSRDSRSRSNERRTPTYSPMKMDSDSD